MAGSRFDSNADPAHRIPVVSIHSYAEALGRLYSNKSSDTQIITQIFTSLPPSYSTIIKILKSDYGEPLCALNELGAWKFCEVAFFFHFITFFIYFLSRLRGSVESASCSLLFLLLYLFLYYWLLDWGGVPLIVFFFFILSLFIFFHWLLDWGGVLREKFRSHASIVSPWLPPWTSFLKTTITMGLFFYTMSHLIPLWSWQMEVSCHTMMPSKYMKQA